MAEENNSKVMSWLMIIAILVGVAIAVGLLLGFIGSLFNFSATMTTGGAGAVVGIVAAALIAKRRAAIAQQSKR
jgi:hypothetical protein